MIQNEIRGPFLADLESRWETIIERHSIEDCDLDPSLTTDLAPEIAAMLKIPPQDRTKFGAASLAGSRSCGCSSRFNLNGSIKDGVYYL